MQHTSFEMQADVFMSLENIWRAFGWVKYKKTSLKYQPVFQKKAPNSIFIIKSQNLKMRGIKI